ncbi:MAG: DNA polymerase I [Gemmatimonadales bacterium]
MAHHNPPQLFLVDGHALIYRAFFALISRPLRTSRGENTSAAWGVVNFLLRLKSKYQPDYLVWVLDKGNSFRAELFPEYKSTRQKLDVELQQDFDLALEHVRDILEAFRIPRVAIDGYEADDVIGTLARREAAQGLQVVIVSGDKDFYQLISPQVALLNPGRGGPAGVDELWVDELNAAERLGVPPRQVVDFLAMVGDTSDNVPGVRGVGDKTAAQLLQEYGDLDTILAKAGEIKAKRPREALLAEADAALLSRRLVTIQTDVPVSVDLASAVAVDPDPEQLRKILTRLEFHSLVNRLDLGESTESAGQPTVAAKAASAVVPTIVSEASELPALAARLRKAPLVALDVRGDGAEPHDAELIGLSLAVGPDEAWYLPFGHRPKDGALAAPTPVRNLPPLTDAACEPLVAVLQDASIGKAAHDLKLQWQLLRRAGVELGGGRFDPMIASFVLDPGRRSTSLDVLSLDYLDRPLPSVSDLIKSGRTQIPFAEVEIDAAARFGAATVSVVLALETNFVPRLAEASLAPLLDEIEMPLVGALTDMEWTGIAIDATVFERLSRELTTDLVRLDGAIAELAGATLNLNSPKQLAAILFEKLGLPVLKKTKTGPSTDADVLEQLAEQGHEVPRLLLEYRELQKLKSTYVDVLPARVNRRTGRIHTRYNQTGAATGRLSSSDPNLQNIPIRTKRGEEIRRGFVPTEGWRFVVADYSQIELRLMAHFSGDPAFVAAFRSGEDIHRQTASLIFGVSPDLVSGEMRSRAKTINFGTIYGQGAFALSKQLKISMEEARGFIESYFTRFAGVRAYLDRQVELARSQGYVETLFKRRRYIPEIKDKNFNTRAFGERLSQNSPLQGSAADLIKIAMVRLHRALREGGHEARLLLQVHDELVVEAPVGEVESVQELVRSCMEGVAELSVPLVVDIGVGENWLDAKR